MEASNNTKRTCKQHQQLPNALIEPTSNIDNGHFQDGLRGYWDGNRHWHGARTPIDVNHKHFNHHWRCRPRKGTKMPGIRRTQGTETEWLPPKSRCNRQNIWWSRGIFKGPGQTHLNLQPDGYEGDFQSVHLNHQRGQRRHWGEIQDGENQKSDRGDD